MDAVDGVGPSNPPLGAEAVVAGAASPATGPASDCEPYRALIGEKLAQGLSGRRIYPDLAAEHGAGGGGSGGIPSYDSIKRFLRHLGKTTPLAYRRMEVAPGQESQVDFGSGAPILGASGKPRAFTVNNSSKPSRRLPAALLQPPRSRSAAYCRNRSTPLGATLRL